MMRNAIRSSIAVVALVLAVPSGADAAPPTTTTRVPAGYRRMTVHKSGFSVLVPDGWLAIDPRAKGVKQAIDAMAAKNPKLAESMHALRDHPDLIRFWAMDQRANGGFAENLNVVLLPIDRSELSDPAGMKIALETQLPGVRVTSAKVAGTKSLRAVATVPLATRDGEVLAYTTSYFVGTDGGVLQFTFSTADDGLLNPRVQTITRSIRLLR